jgi:hypothetical protein
MIRYSNYKFKKQKKKSNHKYLCYTNLLLIITILYFLFNLQKVKDKIIIEYLLVLFLIITIILSQIFWSNPIKGSTIHKIDAINGKIVILSFILYTLLYKFKFSYLLILFVISISFYFSDKYSNQDWCCNKHLFWHGLLHVFCFFATFYAFTPI